MQAALTSRLIALGQEHIVKAWGPTPDPAGLSRLTSQMDKLDQQYPGGLSQYLATARKLLNQTDEQNNTLHGMEISSPHGIHIDVGATPDTDGLAALGKTAFVLVAGGLGERLGFSGIKLALPVETATGMCYIELYARWIKSIEVETGSLEPQPLVIMTSDDTHDLTVTLLATHANFGLAADQITLLKQEKVPAIADITGRFAMLEADTYCISTKPHGHGDVHLVLRQSGLPATWLEKGFEYVLFFQDTNAGTIFTAALSASTSRTTGFSMNSTSIPRKPKEAIGAITRLFDPKNQKELIINVEYNQLETSLPGGDVSDPGTGYSALPGNINTFVLNLATYVRVLAATQGLMPEFINPKYTDSTKTAFKSPTRLECMMQDFPLLLTAPNDGTVGFTQFPRWCYTPVKNNTADGAQKAAAGLDPACAASGEWAHYASYVRTLRSCGLSHLPDPDTFPLRTFLGVPIRCGMVVVLSPSFAPCRDVLRTKFPTPESIRISMRSALVVEGRAITIKSMTLDGAVVIRAVAGAEVIIESMLVVNDGWEIVETTSADLPEPTRMRGYILNKKATASYIFDKPGKYIIRDGITSSL